jgi:DnaD/phage-associated family protein
VAWGDGEERDYKNERKGDTMMQEGREFARAIAMVENCCGKPVGESVRGEIAGFVRSLGEDMIVCALDRAAAYQSRNWGYIRSILQNWEREGVRTPEICRSPVEIGQSREQRSAGYSHCNSPDMYQTHQSKKLSQLELEAIREALEDDDDDYDYPGADRS